MKRLSVTAYGLVLSALIGILASAFLIVEAAVSAVLWRSTNPGLQILVVAAGAGLLYVLLKRWPQMPQTAQTAMVGLKEHQLGDYRLVFVNLLVTLVILSFGAGVGPEAALLSAIITLSSWQADKIRYLYFNYEQVKALPVKTRLQRLLTFNSYLQAYDERVAVKSSRLLRQKRLLYLIFSLNGLLAFFILMRHTDQPSFITKLGASTWHARDWFIILPLIMGAGIYGRLWRWLGRYWHKLIQWWAPALMLKVILGAVGIVVIAHWLPDLLFSGQHSVHLLVGAWQHRDPWLLSGMAAVKLLFLAWCLQFGWCGGDIFPILFASFTQGFAVAAWLPQFDQLVVVAVVATAMAGCLLDNPVVAGIMVLLFCPLNVSPLIIVTVGILVGTKRLKRWERNR
ncbi:chloride channel protein [Lactiplantibacillus garii]|uniref:Chloride channel protein n=1 Tax=Lactiplantibacillus garii TaxID=2306423 RepID=A0A426D6Q9_9LACO|nr:chloride channel protein [Lactiplantibacillus garii]RRK10325.1 chloride channel protein [Lactiplantibacillus garii]